MEKDLPKQKIFEEMTNLSNKLLVQLEDHIKSLSPISNNDFTMITMRATGFVLMRIISRHIKIENKKSGEKLSREKVKELMNSLLDEFEKIINIIIPMTISELSEAN